MVAILGCMFFGAVSGSAPATCAAIGAIMLPQMVRAGYNKYYAVGLIACAGSLGVIVPPSYPMVIYGITTGASIGTLFIGGIGPALLVGSTLIIINYFYCRKHGLKGNKKFDARELGRALVDGFPALLMPVIILGGIYSGVFTATEAAVVSVVYGLIVGFFIYRQLKLKAVIKMLRDNAVFIGGTLLTIAPATAVAQVFSYLGVQSSISQLFLGISTSKYVIMIMIYAVLFVAGMFLQTTPCIVMLTPILLPIAQSVGVDAIQFGLVMVLAMSIAFVTPPGASNLFVMTTMSGIPINKIVMPMLRFMVGLIFCLILVGFFSDITYSFINLFGRQ
jgi:C4-dicarboxylate transporter DctM subunit